MAYFGLIKTNRLKKPQIQVNNSYRDTAGNLINAAGLPAVKVGDYCYAGGSSSSISAGTVGKVIRIDDTRYLIHNPTGADSHTDWSVQYECLDGNIKETWLWYMVACPYSAIQEVKDFYINDGRPQRIKVTW